MKAILRFVWLGLVVSLGCHHRAVEPPATGSPAPVNAAAATPAAPSAAPPPDVPATPPAPPAPPALPATVRIALRTTPGRHASVYWGGKRMGVTPLRLERPRSSGPLDLVLRADGYFPVHVRAYTDADDSLDVALTPLSQRMRLFGAKEEAPAPAAPTPASANAGATGTAETTATQTPQPVATPPPR